MQILKTMERIVMHEGAHGPVPCDDFAGKADDAAQLHASGFKRLKRF
jgi:hypothetical protein